MVKHFDGGSALIEQWLKNKDTVLFLGVREQLNNPVFNSLEFEGIKNEAGRNSFFLSAKKWIDGTDAISLHARAGRYGGTFAHKDIAFEFCSWLSPEFKLYLIKEFQRLKDEESRATSLEWSFQRTLAKVNYKIHTDAIKERLIPPRLTVALTSVNRGGVYYEAGFAHGLGLPVIFMCREGEELHFDIRQYNCIFWKPENLEDAQAQLKNRILATLGQGPKFVQ